MSEQLIQHIAAGEKKVTNQLLAAKRQIENGSQALQALVEPAGDMLSSLTSVYSFKTGCFYLRRKDGQPFAFERADLYGALGILTPRYQLNYCPGQGHIDLPRRIELSEEVVKFLNNLIRQPWSGLELKMYMFGGFVLDKEGALRKDVYAGLCQLAFKTQLDTSPRP